MCDQREGTVTQGGVLKRAGLRGAFRLVGQPAWESWTRRTSSQTVLAQGGISWEKLDGVIQRSRKAKPGLVCLFCTPEAELCIKICFSWFWIAESSGFR